ncbi:hypothetical protein [Marivirga arenosa]|uniref:Gliding motility-associated protein GldM first immunoglobulin-like domain-containing protein n=1 Tax=Marivirga arenosa TaxID=3059076 RepID=A0AA49JHV2_9BACT|nr:hypothetical protein [Marivirga sp. BKB1-2]WKK82950.2 hypothetical protein QYS47_13660 [Marivirga sp. BKB1-2]
MKHFILITILSVLISCTEDKASLEKYLLAQEKYELERLERKANAVSNLLAESTNKELLVKSKLKNLDSLYDKAISDLKNGNEIKKIFDSFKEGSYGLSKYNYSDWEIILSEAPRKYEKLAGTVALTKAKTAILENISMEAGASYMFDQLELMVVPTKKVFTTKENFEAEVIFAAFSSKSEEFMTIVLNDSDTLDIINGKAKIKIDPKGIGKHTIKVNMYDKKGLDLSDDLILEKEITYQVE